MKKKTWIVLIGIVLLLALLPIGVSIAKYTEEKNNNDGFASAIPFYFMIDKLGNTQSEKTWEIYGGDTKEIFFTVANYFDSIRKNASSTTYLISLEVSGTATGVTLNGNSKNLTDGQTDSVTLASGADMDYELIIPEGYGNGDVVTVTVVSSQPYEKAMTLTFNLHHYNHEISYQIKDSQNSPYMELIVTVEHPKDNARTADRSALKAKALKLVWTDVNHEDNLLQIDLTESYLLTDDLKTTTGEKHSTQDYLVAVSTEKPIGIGETVVFRFFKSDYTLDYTTLLQELKSGASYDEVNSVYTITLKPIPQP